MQSVYCEVQDTQSMYKDKVTMTGAWATTVAGEK